MAETKYFKKILAVEGQHPPMPADRLPDFDFEALGRKGWLAQLTGAAVDRAIPLILWAGRAFFPVIKLNGVYWISRADDVEAVLADPATFPVPYGPEMAELCGGHAEPPSAGPVDRSGEINFVLGMEGPYQQRQNALIRRIFLAQDVDMVGDYAAAFSRSLIEGGKGRLDVVSDLSYRVPTEICRRYFGLDFADPDAFAEWAIAVSALLFADPYGDPATREMAHSAAMRLRRIIDAAIQRAGPVRQAAGAGTIDPTRLTLVERLVALSASDPALKLSDAEIRAIMLGLVVGFIPTNGLASAKMIEALVDRPAAFAMARKVAATGDSDWMERILLEAGRLNPALAPGQWRVCPTGGTVGKGRSVPAGATLMVSTGSALRDRRRFARPGAFNPDRGVEPLLIFGHGIHWCLGKYLALRIIREALMPLFALPDLRLAGKMQRTGYFPRRLDMDYGGPTSCQTQVIIAIPIVANGPVDAIRASVGGMGNPSDPTIAAALTATGIVHFSSCSVVEAGTVAKPAPHLLVEINGDGARDTIIAAYAKAMVPWLGPIVGAVLGNQHADCGETLRKYALDLHFGPWGATGLHFEGTGEFSVSDIARQDELGKRARTVLDAEIATQAGPGGGLGTRALRLLAAVRRDLNEASWVDRDDPAALASDAALVKPDRRPLAFALRRPSRSFWAPLADVLRAGLQRRILVTAGVTWIAALLLGYHGWRQGEWLSLPLLARDIASFASALAGFDVPVLLAGVVRAILLSAFALAATILVWALLLGGLVFAFARAEEREQPEDMAPKPDHLNAIAEREDAPGYAQNHIIAVTPLKPGLPRRLSLAFALWGIRQSLYWFRPGFVVTMGTIHYARWFRLPGTQTMIFQSNYDGSWESYLEDFITRAHPGQTAAWSNGIGFPRSKWLINEGARDGDRFKRWVRRQQIPTDFWYSRFPHLTTDEIRRNALIEDGLARVRTDTAARAWIDLIGSAPRQEHELEVDEVQSMLFRGLSRARFSACIPLRLPDGNEARWLREVRDGTAGQPISFGQHPKRDRALYVALSPAGLARFRRPVRGDEVAIDPLAQFPGVFTRGMSGRHKVLRDPDPAGGQWRWADGEAGPVPVADAVLLIYAPDPEALDAEVDRQLVHLRKLGGDAVHSTIRTVLLDQAGHVQQPDARGSASFEHFGFRDGIAQPVIRGMERFSPGSESQDIVAAGEFVLGYRNNQGYFPPAITVSADSDDGNCLPVTVDATTFGHADFEDVPEDDLLRDFGRNGSFLVIRQLRQNVQAFRDATVRQADALRTRYGPDALRRTVGEDVSDEWVAAKLMGRWRDGRPLIGSPRAEKEYSGGRPDNDFLYGRDDPRGHQCPLGSHIRRSNPRDSLEPGDMLEQTIANRHRILRRGRSYLFDSAKNRYLTADPDGEVERGMLFMCLCGDLERQFEFVQQTWVTSPSFHGLTAEPDPITADASQPGTRNFSIPTSSGPLTLENVASHVELTGGGYFFLPSRSAIDYLAALDASVPARSTPRKSLPPSPPLPARAGRARVPAGVSAQTG